MHKKSFLRPIIVFGIITILFASCDKDFNELGTNIVGESHYGFELDSTSTVKTYNQKLGPVATNNLPVNPLGFYDNPAFGKTQANFVTQVELASVNPIFNNIDPADYGDFPTTLDSVVMEIPYFVKLVKTVNRKSTYTLDSIYGAKPYDSGTPSDDPKFSLQVYRSGYFLRDLDPSQALAAQQPFYTDDDNLIDGSKMDLINDPSIESESSKFYFDKREHLLKALEDDNVTLDTTRTVPSMRLHLNKTVFDNAIIHAPSGVLVDNATFKNYFRGVYFKVSNGNPGNMAMMNFKSGKITLYYRENKKTTPATGDPTFSKVSKTLALNLTGNSVSLLKNTGEDATYLANTANGGLDASRLYLKGGEGAMTVIDLFGTVDTKGYVLNPNYDESKPISTTNPKYNLTGPNGISDEIDDIKYNGWLINEANLTFYVDRTAMKSDDPVNKLKVVEPNRVYLYDLTNHKVLIDYAYDFTSNSAYPKFSKAVYGGYLADKNGLVVKQIRNSDGEISAKGTKYKVRLTNYVRNLVKNDSTNIRLGLSLTENIATTTFSKLRNANSNLDRVPTVSAMSPTGTILYGSNIPSNDQDYGKRVKLEIYYTKP